MQWNPDKGARTGGYEGTPHRGGRPLIILYHQDFLLHDPTPIYHPENPERLALATASLKAVGGITWREPEPEDAKERYSMVHDEHYINLVYDAAERAFEPAWIDADTYVVKGTITALERLAGAATETVELLLAGRDAFILGRPPGHHAGRRGRALGAPTLGFCIFNTSALVSKMLSEKGRVAVLDFDLHHGNGTQDILWNDGIVHIDIHQDPSTIYPGTGFPWQSGGVRGTKINLIVPPGSGDDIYQEAVTYAFDLIRDYDPDYLVVSAGFDAYQGDYAGMKATRYTYSLIGGLVGRLDASVAIVLEGGYEAGLREGLPAFVAGVTRGHSLGEPVTASGKWQWERFRYWMERLREELEGRRG
ncbi:MAG: histone deacetylase family protein [Desulfurococcales archaeon]|nr:histone deacetylase family protein [Desulfurococcales archaeon]